MLVEIKDVNASDVMLKYRYSRSSELGRMVPLIFSREVGSSDFFFLNHPTFDYSNLKENFNGGKKSCEGNNQALHSYLISAEGTRLLCFLPRSNAWLMVSKW